MLLRNVASSISILHSVFSKSKDKSVQLRHEDEARKCYLILLLTTLKSALNQKNLLRKKIYWARTFCKFVRKCLTLSAPIPQNGHTLAIRWADEVFDCVWPFYGIGAWNVNNTVFLLGKGISLKRWKGIHVFNKRLKLCAFNAQIEVDQRFRAMQKIF